MYGHGLKIRASGVVYSIQCTVYSIQCTVYNVQ